MLDPYVLRFVISALAMLMLLGTGCPADDDDAADDDDTADDDDNGDDDDVDIEGIVGGMQVNSMRIVTATTGNVVEHNIASVWGFWDNPWPGEIFGMVPSPPDGANGWEVTEKTGDCGLMTFQRAACDDDCEQVQPASYCDAATLECVPYPELANAGTLTLEGPDLSLSWPADDYWNKEVPANSMSAGDLIEFTAAGDRTAAFAVATTAVHTLEHDLVCHRTELGLVPGEDMAVTWTPAGDARVRLDIIPYNHGGAKDRIYCDTEDSGSLTIPAALVDWHMGGNTDFMGLLTFTRYNLATVDIGGGHLAAIEVSDSWQCYSWY